MPNLAQPQPRRVGGHEEDALLQVARGLKQTNEFLLAVDFRQLAGRLAARAQIETGLAEDLPIQEGNGRSPQVTGARRQLALDQQVVQIRPHFFQVELIGRALIVAGQAHDAGDVALDGALRELPEFHLANHPLA